MNSKFQNVNDVMDAVPSSLNEMKVFVRLVQDIRIDWETEINILKIKDRVKLRLRVRPEESLSPSTPSSTTQIDAICEDMNAVLDTLANWKACEEKIERVDVDSRHVRMKYEDQLRNDLNEFESACEETRNDMLKNGPASDKSLLDLHAGALKLNEFKTKIVDLSNRREALRDSEKAFQFPPRSVSSLQELRENIEEYMSCYAVIERFDSKVKVHSCLLWDAIDIEKLRAIAEESKGIAKQILLKVPRHSN